MMEFVFELDDTGKRIPMEMRKWVFEKWEHLNHALERLIGFSRQGSMGRAECSSRNESLSLGSRELPLIGMDGIDSKTPITTETSQTPSKRTTGQKHILNKEGNQGAFKPSEDELLSGKRVMVVDDNHITSAVSTRKLKKMGVSQVKQCYSGKEAVRLVNEWFTQRGSSEMLLPFDYIFMDCQMPEMDGYEATREIRKMEKKYGGGLHIPIIAVSGHDHGSREAIETIQAGMDAFLEKNLNQDHIAKVIREITSKVQNPQT